MAVIQLVHNAAARPGVESPESVQHSVLRPDDGHGPGRVLEALSAGEVEVFHTPAGDGYATLDAGGHRETWSLRSRQLRRWLVRTHYERTGKALAAHVVAQALQLLEARAAFDGPTCEVYTRAAPAEGGGFWLDLGDAAWRALEVSAAGWRIADGAPVKFRRARGLLPLPEPSRGGSLDTLRRFLPLGSDDDWRLVLAWLTAALRPQGPYPILSLHGEQGSGKSTAARLLRRLVDPSSAPLRSEPRCVRDLMVSATNSWVLAYDNLSRLQPWLSDALCRLSTGGGYATRELYSDAEEAIFDAMRPLILTGIEEVATRGDLVERSLVVELPRIPPEARLDERRYWQEVDAALPQLLGAVLDAASGALREIRAVRIEKLPRMADFAVWGVALERTLGWQPGSFLAAYETALTRSSRLSIDGDPVAEALLTLAAARRSWSGRASELLAALKEHVDETAVCHRRGWPENPQAFSGRLRRLAPALRRVGLRIEMPSDAARQGRDRKRLVHFRLES
jgi:hypothetical protein